MQSKVNQIFLDKLLKIYEGGKDKIFKIVQYLALLLSWYYNNKKQSQLGSYYFTLFKTIFNIRRINRLGHFINFLPKIQESFRNAKKGFSIERISLLISHIGKFIFYILDNISIIMNIIDNQYYKIARRLSFTVFLVAILSSLVHFIIKLRSNFSKEAQLKNLIVKQLAPKQFLKRLNDLDQERFTITLQILSNVGDLLPTLQRMNFTSTVLMTRANKGVSGVFGMLSGASQLIKIIQKT